MQMFSDMATGFGFFDRFHQTNQRHRRWLYAEAERILDTLFGNPYGAVVTWQPAVPFSGARLERELFYRGCMFRQKLGRPNERFMGYVERTGANLSATGC